MNFAFYVQQTEKLSSFTFAENAEKVFEQTASFNFQD